MTDEELKAIEARCEAATAGPWACAVDRGDGFIVHASASGRADVVALDAGRWSPGGDCDFIAHARQDIPTLLAEVRRLQADQTQGGKDYCSLMDRHDAWQVRALNAEDEVSRLRRAIGHWVKSAREYGAASEADIFKLESALTTAPAPEPRYSTAAVDALLADLDEVIRLDQRVTREFCLNDSVAAVRASREPKI